MCEAYWYPLYAYVRRRGHSADDASDIVQSFFTRLLDKQALSAVDPALGRFRAFLLASMKNFLANQWDRDSAKKRGGGWVRVDVDMPDFERRYLAIRQGETDPEHLFDRQWALTLLDRALARLGRDEEAAGRREQFGELAGFLTNEGANDRSYRDVGAALGLNEGAVRTAVHRLRQRFGTALRAEVAETVHDAVEADAELRHLLAVASA